MGTMNITIIGLGLIGGSMAIDLKRRGFAGRITGVDSDPLHAAVALKLGIVDATATLEEALAGAGLVVLATPVDATLALLPGVLDRIDGQTVTDVCSTKEAICRAIRNHPKRKQFVAAHPMAGTEYSGPWAAREGLFDGKAVIITDPGDSDPQALAMVHRLYDTLNMRPIVIVDVATRADDIHTATSARCAFDMAFSSLSCSCLLAAS